MIRQLFPMKKTLLLIIVCLSYHLCSAQDTAIKECGTKAPVEPIRVPATSNKNQRPVNGKRYVKLFIHNIANNDGTGEAWTQAEINTELAWMRKFFDGINICIIILGYDVLWNSSWLNFDISNIRNISNSFDVPDALDVYLHNTLMDGSNGLNGNAYGIPNGFFSLGRSAIGQRSWAHEMGHCFGLYHTFETEYGEECPDESDCEYDGDLVCDTPADFDDDAYKRANTNATTCVYTGNRTVDCLTWPFTDEQTYNPPVKNIMTYGRRTSRQEITYGQATRVNYFLDNNLNGLTAEGLLTISGNNGATSVFHNTNLVRVAVQQINIGSFAWPVNGNVVNSGNGFTLLRANRVVLSPGTKFSPSGDGQYRIRAVADWCSVPSLPFNN